MKVELFDTHAHFEGTHEEISEQLRRAYAAGVGSVMAVGGSEALNHGVELAAVAVGGVSPSAEMPRIYRALGYDRDQIGSGDLPTIDYTGVDAVGEIGLDYHYSPGTRVAQMKLFASQLELSRKLDLPVVIHTREADDDTLGLLREIPVRGVIHSFTGGVDFCKRLLDLGFMISYSGIVTFKSADNVRASAVTVPDDRILVETDSPFLAPVPKRGNANEPAFVVHTAEFLAHLRGATPEAFAALTTANARRMLAARPSMD